MTDYLWLIPGLPLLGFVLNGLLGKPLGKGFVTLVGPGMVGASFLLSVAALLEMLDTPGYQISQTLYTWMEAGSFSVPVAFTVDRLSGLYILIVTGVGFLIHLYSVGYMGDEKDYAYFRFFAYLNLFIFFMLTLVLADNFLLLFVGWEGVGLCSYLLIGYYYDRDSAAEAAKKAFVVNRIGDFGYLIATFLIFVTFGTLDFAAVTSQAEGTFLFGGLLVTGVTLLLFLGCTGKSAQIPLYVWLPDAMEGPTPVSALIHAATMVTAGLYLIARLSAVFVLAPTTMAIIAGIGAATALFAATIGMAQYDIKRVLAYSTVSQLGYMFLAMGVGAFMTGVFHVMTHAFFKALLFMGSGSVMHALHGELDMRKMGGLKKHMPITAYTYIIGALAIGGFPLLTAGFFSKDEILWNAFASPWGGPVLWAIGAGTALLTGFYMFRTVGLTFFGASRVDPHQHPHESTWTMWVPLVVLAALSVVGGWIGIPHLLGHPLHIPNVLEGYFEGFFAEVPAGAGHHAASVEWTLMGVTTVGSLLAMYLAYVLFSSKLALAEQLREKLKPVFVLLNNKYWIDEVYYYLVVRPIHLFSRYVLWQAFDAGVIDGVVNGVGKTARNVGGALRLAQNGIVETYAIGIALGALLIFWYLVY